MYKNRTGVIILPLVVAIALVAGLLAGTFMSRMGADAEVGSALKAASKKNKLSYTLSLIESAYVDPVNMDTIGEHMIPLLLEELDPHSVYIPASEFADANETLDGHFDGIGIVFNMMTDTVVVLNVIPAGPSDKAGLRAGDRIINVGDSVVAGRKMDQDKVVKMLRGPRGTQVRLGIERQGLSSLVNIDVTRGVIPIKSIEAGIMLTPTVGFLKLSSFSRNSHSEMMAALERMRKDGMKGLIFDLRGNSGGFLDQAIEIANEFLPSGKLIVYTLDRAAKRTEEFSDGRGRFTDLPLAVLIDEGSASSSEILAGALQDNDRGVIIGRRSFGKGLVQQQFMFPDHSAVRLTVARYYTPAGRSIQKPYVNGNPVEYEKDLISRMEHNEFFSADSIKFADSLRYQTVGGRTVYGGGGIMPDLFIPLDTTDVTRYFLQVSGRNILFRYAMDYADRHRAQLEAVSDVASLRALLDSDKGMFDDFVAYAARRGVAPVRSEVERSRKLITAQLRAYIGRNSPLDEGGFYANIYVVDNTLLKAIDYLSK